MPKLLTPALSICSHFLQQPEQNTGIDYKSHALEIGKGISSTYITQTYQRVMQDDSNIKYSSKIIITKTIWLLEYDSSFATIIA